MTDYTITQTYTLPTRGKVYNKPVSAEIKLRSMTTADEMKRLNHSDRMYKSMSTVIDDCLVDPIGISAYDLCIADYQFLLHKLRIVTYGTRYKSSTVCPYCSSENEHVLNLETDLEFIEFDEDSYKKWSEITLPVTGKRIKLRIQSPRVLDDIALKSKEIRRTAPQFVGDPSFITTLQYLIETVDGNEYEDFQLQPFLQNLPMADVNYILKAAQKINTSFGIMSEMRHVCPLCGLTYKSSFRTTTEFFGPSVDF